MGDPWTDHPSWELVADASDLAGRDLGHLLLRADADELTETRNAQLATFTLSLIVLDSVERMGVEPTACAGHSLGEYTALVAAGSLGFDEGVAIVAERGDAMQAAADERHGVMRMVLGLDDDAVEVACRRADGDVWVANHNAPGNLVIAGDDESVDRAAAIALTLGARKVSPVTVGGAFHTPFMAPARNRLRKALRAATFHEPEVPVVANVDGLPHQAAEDWEGLLSAQLCSPVRWRQSVLELAGLTGGELADNPAGSCSGERLFVEVGAGGVLAGLIRQITPAATAISLSTPADLEQLVEAVADHTALQAFVADHHGEHLYVSERMVISPCAGVFEPAPVAAEGELIEVGSLVGRVGQEEVRSPFRGWLMGMLAFPGERVQTGQPVAWLRAG
jgi:[acyl-carrier-protein] S-malonyltransferase